MDNKKWFTRNGLSLNLKKTKIIKADPNYKIMNFQNFLKDELIQEEINTKFLGVGTDKNMNWKTHEPILPKLSSAHYAIRSMTHYSNIETNGDMSCIFSTHL
jgi:hypothetical protein